MGKEEDGEMAFRLRSSKFRHVYGNPSRRENCFENIKISRNAHDSSFCAVNPKFVAIVTESGGGGSFITIPVNKPGRVETNFPKVCGHRGPVLDIKWYPFDDNIIASCSDDATVKIWQIPDGGLKTNMTEWQVDLHGHQRRVGYLEWHPTAENILLSAGFDNKCILWNIETAEPINIINCHKDNIHSINWNRDGSLFSTTSKDKMLRVVDPRSGETAAETVAQSGPRISKCVFLGDTSNILTCGFTRSCDRQIALWDVRHFSNPLSTEEIDTACGTLFPIYDHDIRVVYLAGKGDGNIRYFEISDEAPHIHYLNQYMSPHPQRGIGVMPKRGLDIAKHEIARFYKLHSSARGVCEPLSMIVPRKSDSFQADVYPPTPSSTPSLTADEWISGQSREPILVSLKDGHVSNNPVITTAKAVQKKDGNISHTPVITTYKATKGQTPDYTTLAWKDKGQNQVPANKLPNSVRNIQRLSESVKNTGSGDHMNEDKIRLLEDEEKLIMSQTLLPSTDDSRTLAKKTWMSTPSPIDLPANQIPNTNPESPRSPKSLAQAYMTLDSIEIIDTTPPILPQSTVTKLTRDAEQSDPSLELVKPSSLGLSRAKPPTLTKLPTLSVKPTSSTKSSGSRDSENIHVVKVWSPGSDTPSSGIPNGIPKTDPELRRAYFQQLEEIRSLKQEVGLKDKRIRQLEDELRKCKSETCNGQLEEQVSESSC
ncbi:coronin-2B isoform X2 [Lingula anatina]|uniref:Coronin n=1 Tax=Lingula anatina TaxID=7574 RepID=A0A1S3HPY1_LINAN|nr:coronin-2B isoform X2 [Lingula anatina]XP_013387584.1 coronin-2B isoform X2 [Lingula anatina]XP_013387592.1 coronin-2B isoform X2 [Lingula anatina]XP_013387601.1 coronin-2B isoform X2 [Lingula anatina]|eukprot:XP_013387577.1 coronin-2B isoform X2 [Lingula anatina]